MDQSDSTTAKTCTKCGIAKPVSEYHKDKQRSDGRRPSCKVCKAISSTIYRAANQEKLREATAAWAAANPDRRRKNKRAWRALNRAKVNAESAAYRAANPEKVKASQLARYRNNPDREKARSAAYKKANKEKVKAYVVAFREKYPERVLAYASDWREANRERSREICAAWRKSNPDAVRVSTQNRRALIQKNGGVLSKGLAKRLFEMQKGKCPCCKQPLGENYHLDHKMPLALGGTNTDDNMQLLRAICNLNKAAKHPVDFMQSRGYLL